MAPTLIGLEEHFVAQTVINRSSSGVGADDVVALYPKSVARNLFDLGQNRINMIDQGQIKIQVLSHVGAVQPPEVCHAVNDELFEAVKGSSGRYRGFAFPPMGTPDAIPAELERCVKELGFVGALIPNHADGTFYDGDEYWPMFAKAEELDVPIYLHPTPAEDMARFAGNYPRAVQTLIAGPGFSWHTEVGMHVLRLYGSGLFDRYPRLKIVLGHNGEALPFMCDRISKFFEHRWGGNKRDWMTVWNENIWITTAGMFHLTPLECCLKMCKPDRVLYSLDYPFEDPVEGLEFMQLLEQSGLVSPAQFEMITHGNAEKLLKL